MTTTTTAAVETPQKPAKARKSKDIPGITRAMTYEEYLASPEEMARYDIIDGFKVYRKYGAKKLPNPTREHQRILRRIARPMEDFEARTHAGEMIVSPCDVLVRRNPTRSRQPDLLFISSERLAQNPPSDDPEPLSPAPELVVEILSPSDTRRVQAAKIGDYVSVGVLECWLVSPEAETVEVLRLSPEGAETVDVYGRGQTVASITFPELTIPVNDIFTE